MNIYCFSTLSFAKLQFKSVINKAFHKHGVASFTDAWIETLLKKSLCRNQQSHLLQMRGLKPICGQIVRRNMVASFTDAWIETGKMLNGRKSRWSRIFYRCVDWNKAVSVSILLTLASHLLQMRGLKHPKKPKRLQEGKVASFTDAWIETYQGRW